MKTIDLIGGNKKKPMENWHAPFRRVGSSWKGDQLVTSTFASGETYYFFRHTEFRGCAPVFGSRQPTVKMFGYLYEMSKYIANNRKAKK